MLTHEDVKKLSRTFDLEDHEFNRGMCYIKEEQVNQRLTEIDPAWSMTEITYEWRSELHCVAYGGLTIKGVTRYGVGEGTSQPSLDVYQPKDGKEIDPRKLAVVAENAAKSAATDLLKRLARLFGVGLYLTRSEIKGVKNHNDLKRFLAQINSQNGSSSSGIPTGTTRETTFTQVHLVDGNYTLISDKGGRINVNGQYDAIVNAGWPTLDWDKAHQPMQITPITGTVEYDGTRWKLKSVTDNPQTRLPADEPPASNGNEDSYFGDDPPPAQSGLPQTIDCYRIERDTVGNYQLYSKALEKPLPVPGSQRSQILEANNLIASGELTKPGQINREFSVTFTASPGPDGTTKYKVQEVTPTDIPF